MSQNENYTRPKSSSSNSYGAKPSPEYTNNTTSPKMSNSYQYSSSAYTQTRHYASPEESDAVLPVFSTPTHMYLKQELNSTRYNTPSPKQQYAASPTQKQYSPTQQQQQQQQNRNGTNNGTSNGYYEQKLANPPGSPSNNIHLQQYGRTRGESSPVKPSMDNFGMNSMENEIKKMNSGSRQPERQSYNNRTAYTATPTHSPTPPPDTTTSRLTPQQDLILAQLVDMGFTLEASRIAMIASGGTNLQEILDILVQDAKAENQIPSQQQPTSFKPNPPTRPTNGYQSTTPSNNFATPPPPPPSRPSEPPKTSSPNDDEDDEEDPRLEKEREEKFKKEQEERRREYLEQLKREKPTPPPPGPRPPPKTASPTQPKTTSDPATFFADKERKEGNFLFNKNKFPEAEAAYTLAIDALPADHSELVLLSNNRAAARLKQNKYHECLADCSVAIDIARKQMTINSGDSATWKAQMIKALHRKASALEGLHLYEAAIGVYEEYVRMDGSRSAQVTQGIMRCQQALLSTKKQPPPQPPRPTNNGPTWKPTNDMSAFPDIDFNMFIPKQTPEEKANLEEINKSKAVQEMRDREKKKEAEEAERLSKEDKVSAQISVWKTGKDRNLRALLGSLELILWPGVQWKGLTMGELLEPRKCKIAYMKAIAKVHPDKLPANATVEQRMLASGIFTALNQAWDIFRKENNL